MVVVSTQGWAVLSGVVIITTLAIYYMPRSCVISMCDRLCLAQRLMILLAEGAWLKPPLPPLTN